MTRIRSVLSLRSIVLAIVLIAMRAAHARAETLTLPDAIQRALAFSPSIEMASATGDLTEARTREMRAPLMPSIGAGTEYYQAPGYAEVITNRGLSAAMLALDYTAIDFGRRMARVRSARYAAEAARFGVAAARAQIVFDTRTAYYRLVRAKAVLAELQSNRERLSRYVSTVETLQRSGRVIRNDVLKVRATRDTSELALAGAENDLRRSAIVLGSLIGDFAHSDFEVSIPPGIPPLPRGDSQMSPTLLAANRAIAAAKMQVTAAQAERYPNLQLALTAGYLGIDPTDTIDHHLGASYDGVISMPVFEGGLISSHIDQAKARMAQTVAQARQAQYLIRQRLDDAALRYSRAQQSLALLDRAQPTADDAFALTWTRFLGGGSATLLEVLDSYEQAETLRLARFDHEFAARQASAETALLYGEAK